MVIGFIIQLLNYIQYKLKDKVYSKYTKFIKMIILFERSITVSKRVKIIFVIAYNFGFKLYIIFLSAQTTPSLDVKQLVRCICTHYY